jgi:FkbM family methyltransferase
MFKQFVKKLLQFFGYSLIKINRKLPNSFVNEPPSFEEIRCIVKSSGILHLGAHRGKEAEIYQWFNKKVLWIEANPNIFSDLNNHIKYYFKQVAINALLGDENKKKNFFVSNRDASCSSIFDLSNDVKNKKLWKNENIMMEKKINLTMKKLDTLLADKKIEIKNYNHWILDLQGSEIQVLKGSIDSLKYCKSMVVEISKKKFYENGSTQWVDLKKFLEGQGFKVNKEPSSDHCDVLFEKIN